MRVDLIRRAARVLSDRIPRLVPFVALLGGLAHFVAASPRYALTHLPLDDAWTHQVYASALAAGQGFAYNPGVQEAGFTSPLWVLLTAPLHGLEPLGTDAVIVGIKLLGALLAAWIVWEAAHLGREWKGELVGVVAGVVVALQPRLLFSALSGMETLLAVGLWLAAARAIRTRRWTVLGVCLGLAPLARPEMIVLWPLAGLAWLSVRGRTTGTGFGGLRRVPLVALPVLAWSLFCLFVNGHPLPNTFYVKAEPTIGNPLVVVGLALYYLGRHGLLATVAGWLAIGGFLGFALSRHERDRSRDALLLVGGPLLYAFGVVFSRDLHPSGYYWTRWVDPASLVLTVAAAVGLGGLVATLARRVRRGPESPGGSAPVPKLERAFALLVVAALLLQSGDLVRSWQDRRTHLVSDARAIGRLNVAAGLWLREHSSPTEWIAVNDAGALRYFSRRRTLDLMGLNAAPLAFGTTSRDALLEDSNVRWLAIFPGWFDDPEGRAMLGRFEPRAEFAMPLEEYTVCDCPTQTRIVIYERAAADREPDG